MLAACRDDVRAVRERDPAARTTLEIVLCYPGLHAIWGQRVSHWLWTHDLQLAGRALSALTRWLTGVDIHPGATLGPGLFIDHAAGVVIGETADLGANVTIYQGVTLGGTSLQSGKRHPSVGDRVTIGAGAKVLGPLTIGHDSRIGANAVVINAVPANSIVVGVPGQIVSRSQPRPVTAPPDLDATSLPDLFGITLRSLLGRVDHLEESLPNHNNSSPTHAQPSEAGVWAGEDFSI
jgi:serine O-acetyltransferase